MKLWNLTLSSVVQVTIIQVALSQLATRTSSIRGFQQSDIILSQPNAHTRILSNLFYSNSTTNSTSGEIYQESEYDDGRDEIVLETNVTFENGQDSGMEETDGDENDNVETEGELLHIDAEENAARNSTAPVHEHHEMNVADVPHKVQVAKNVSATVGHDVESSEYSSQKVIYASEPRKIGHEN